MPRPATEFELLAPLIVKRDPVCVRRILWRRERGELTLDATIEELNKLPIVFPSNGCDGYVFALDDIEGSEC